MTKLSDNIVYDLFLSYLKTAALRAAIELDLFTKIGKGPINSDNLAHNTGSSQRGIRILCDFLCIVQLLEKTDGLYSLSDVSRRFLDRNSSHCIADIIDFMAAPEIVSKVMNIPSSYVKTGGLKQYTGMSSEDPLWKAFAEAMAPFAAIEAKRTTVYVKKQNMQPTSILDVAAGSGLFGIELAKQCKEAMVTAIDWAGVLEIAGKNAEAAGLSGRYRTIAGNALEEDWGTGYDLILLPNLLHHFSPDDCIGLFKKSKASLTPGGSVFLIEIIPNADRISPPEQASFAFFMLATTADGDAYTHDEYVQMARVAGLSLKGSMRLLPTAQTVLDFVNHPLDERD